MFGPCPSTRQFLAFVCLFYVAGFFVSLVLTEYVVCSILIEYVQCFEPQVGCSQIRRSFFDDQDRHGLSLFVAVKVADSCSGDHTSDRY